MNIARHIKTCDCHATATNGWFVLAPQDSHKVLKGLHVHQPVICDVCRKPWDINTELPPLTMTRLLNIVQAYYRGTLREMPLGFRRQAVVALRYIATQIEKELT